MKFGKKNMENKLTNKNIEIASCLAMTMKKYRIGQIVPSSKDLEKTH